MLSSDGQRGTDVAAGSSSCGWCWGLVLLSVLPLPLAFLGSLLVIGVTYYVAFVTPVLAIAAIVVGSRTPSSASAGSGFAGFSGCGICVVVATGVAAVVLACIVLSLILW